MSLTTGLLITGMDWNHEVCVHTLWYAVTEIISRCVLIIVWTSSNLSTLGHTSFMKQDTELGDLERITEAYPNVTH